MIKIEDYAILISSKEFSNNNLIIKLLSANNQIYKGIVKYNKKNLSQIGDVIYFSFFSKNNNNTGYLKIENHRSSASKLLLHKYKLLLINNLFKIIDSNFIENYNYNNLFNAIKQFINLEHNIDIIIYNYIKILLDILYFLGYAIEMDNCALCGTTSNLYYLSPKSLKICCQKCGKKYDKKLLKIPSFLRQKKIFIEDEIDLEELKLFLIIFDYIYLKFVRNNKNIDIKIDNIIFSYQDNEKNKIIRHHSSVISKN